MASGASLMLQMALYTDAQKTLSGVWVISVSPYLIMYASIFLRSRLNSAKWTWFAIGYQCVFAYVIALMINQFGGLFTGNANILGVIVAVILLAGIIYMLCKPYKEATKLAVK